MNTTQQLKRRRSDLVAASPEETTWIRPAPGIRWSQLLFRAAVIVTVPTVLLLCALLVFLAQVGQGEA
jgi:hypothetical protein